MRRNVSDVMTTDVVCVSRETPYKELVRLLVGRRVSALPVVDDRHHVVGVVSEADLLLKQSFPHKPRRLPCWWAGAGASSAPRPAAWSPPTS